MMEMIKLIKSGIWLINELIDELQFQNRRAKLKRDMEELKKDVESAKILGAHHHHHHHHHHHKGYTVAAMAEMSLLQKKADEYNQAIAASDWLHSADFIIRFFYKYKY